MTANKADQRLASQFAVAAARGTCVAPNSQRDYQLLRRRKESGTVLEPFPGYSPRQTFGAHSAIGSAISMQYEAWPRSIQTGFLARLAPQSSMASPFRKNSSKRSTSTRRASIAEKRRQESSAIGQADPRMLSKAASKRPCSWRRFSPAPHSAVFLKALSLPIRSFVMERWTMCRCTSNF